MTESDPQHPLDEALRRQLAEYGQAPGPAVWAGVRRNLPGATPLRPRWRRKRTLLLLVALLPVFIGTLFLFRTHNNPLASSTPNGPVSSARRGKETVISRPEKTATLATTNQQETSPSVAPKVSVATQPSAVGPETVSATESGEAAGREEAKTTDVAVSRPRQTPLSASRQPMVAAARPAKHSAVAIASAAGRIDSWRHTAAVALVGRSQAAARSATRPAGSSISSTRTASESGAVAVVRSRGEATAPSATPILTGLNNGIADNAAAGKDLAAVQRAQKPGSQPVAVDVAETISEDGLQQPRGQTSPAETVVMNAGSPFEAAAGRAAIARLSSRSKLQVLPGRPLPAPLAAGPDSARAVGSAPRRWAAQVVAGPTLSYRTLNQPLVPNPADASRLERPATGMGAQVQLRRTLSGRLALATGLGYQQYASRLDLEVVTNPSRGSSVVTTVVQSVHRRDTYNLLVAPVQLSYALGVGGRWQVAVLGGFEPALYLSGLSTDAAASPLANAPVSTPNPSSTPNSSPTTYSYDYTQRIYSGPAASPYRAWSLGLSLGLDLRLRPTPASRWQLLVQPVGRYIATPFMRETATDYSRRPFSVGVLGGFSWDLR
jgi:hypothetical protein